MSRNDSIESHTIAWPAMVRLANEDDISIVDSWEEWVHDPDLSGYDEPGLLISRDGQVYDLEFEPRPGLAAWLGPKGFQRPVARGEQWGRKQLLEFVRPQVVALGADAENELAQLARSHDRESLAAALISFLKARL